MRLLILIPLLALVGCGFLEGDPTPPPTHQALGGVWIGTASDGLGINALSTDNGRLHWQMGIFREFPENPIQLPLDPQPQAFGTASVYGNAVTINYTLVVPLGSTLLDGSTSATCSGIGTIQQRQRLTVSRVSPPW